MQFDLSFSRRDILHLLAGSAALAAGMTPGSATEARIGRLIDEARGKGSISQRLDFISGALRGSRYQGYTLIGGPKRREQFVVRDDAFDCVTFCETVLAAAIAGNPGEFDAALAATVADASPVAVKSGQILHRHTLLFGVVSKCSRLLRAAPFCPGTSHERYQPAHHSSN